MNKVVAPYSSKTGNTPAVNNVVIVGGGTSGWMCAAAIARISPPSTNITLVESEDIGVDEATIPTLMEFSDFLGIKENDLRTERQGTFKLGIDFVDWYRKAESHFHHLGFYGRDLFKIYKRLKKLSLKLLHICQHIRTISKGITSATNHDN